MANSIEVFQDLTLIGPVERKADLKAALIARAVSPWSIDFEQSAAVEKQAITSDDVLLFRCEPSIDYPAIGLTLWGTDVGYYVPNIVPMEMGSLTYRQYNAALTKFIEYIVEPVASQFGFAIGKTNSSQTLEDWVALDTALKLRRFSLAANKSTGASHPMDQRRWFDFLIAAHREQGTLDASQLGRWLMEVEGWDEDIAHKLAGDFENGLALLSHYDTN